MLPHLTENTVTDPAERARAAAAIRRSLDEPTVWEGRLSWANYGETQPVPENGEPPEPYLV